MFDVGRSSFNVVLGYGKKNHGVHLGNKNKEKLVMESLLKDTIQITQAAGDVIMQYYKSSYDVENKSPDNPVTDADYAADTLLHHRLTNRLPEA